MKIECITLLDDKDANFHLDRKKSNIFPRISRFDLRVPCMALQHTWNRLVSNNWTEDSVKILARQ